MEERFLEILSDLCEDDIVKKDKNIELFENDLLDSLTFAEMLFSIEEEFGVFISPSEVERKDIDTPQKIIDMIKSRG